MKIGAFRQAKAMTAFSAVFALSMGLSACGGEGGASGDGSQEAVVTQEVVFAQSDPGLSFAPVYVADAQGYFADEGLDVQLETMTPSVAMSALANGQIDYAGTIGSVARAAAEGAPVKIASVWYERTPFFLVANEKIKAMEDLRGEALGVSSFGSTSDIALRFALTDSGLDPENDVEIIQLGGTAAARISAVQTGQVAGVTVTPPDHLIAENRGLVLLYETTDKLLSPFTGLGTSEQKLEEDPEQIKKMIHATHRALDYMKSDPEDSAAIIAEVTSAEEDLILEALKTMNEIASPDGLATTEALTNLARPAGSTETPDLHATFDFSALFDYLSEEEIPLGANRPDPADVS